MKESIGEMVFALDCKKHNLEPQREVCLIQGRKWRFDFYFMEKHLVVEIEGGTFYGKSRHSTGPGFEKDCEKYNTAALAGITVLRFTTRMVQSGQAINTVLEALGA
jgi:very-short-patch-repair endonuclease